VKVTDQNFLTVNTQNFRENLFKIRNSYDNGKDDLYNRVTYADRNTIGLADDNIDYLGAAVSLVNNQTWTDYYRKIFLNGKNLYKVNLFFRSKDCIFSGYTISNSNFFKENREVSDFRLASKEIFDQINNYFFLREFIEDRETDFNSYIFVEKWVASAYKHVLSNDRPELFTNLIGAFYYAAARDENTILQRKELLMDRAEFWFKKSLEYDPDFYLPASNLQSVYILRAEFKNDFQSLRRRYKASIEELINNYNKKSKRYVVGFAGMLCLKYSSLIAAEPGIQDSEKREYIKRGISFLNYEVSKYGLSANYYGFLETLYRMDRNWKAAYEMHVKATAFRSPGNTF
jgi:hypothetical protein